MAMKQGAERRRQWADFFRQAVEARPELRDQTERSLARLLDVAPTTPGTWLKAANVPKEPEVLEAIARVTHRSRREVLEAAGYLVAEEDAIPEATLSPEEKTVVHAMRTADEEYLRLILQAAKVAAGTLPYSAGDTRA